MSRGGGAIPILQHWGEMGPKWHCDVMVEAANPRWLHPTSILDVYEVFEHIHMLWLGLWVQSYCINCAGGGGWIFWTNGVRLSQMTLWCHGWGCKRSQTASHIHIGGIWSVWAPSWSVDGHMGAPLHCNTCAGGGGDFLEKWSSKIEPNDIVEPWLRLGTTTDCIPHPYWMYMKCFSTLICCWWAYGCNLT